MKTISFANHKGGVRKTTLSVSIADALARDGFRVLLVDLDPQAQATALAYSFNETPTTTIERVLTKDATLGEAITESQISGVDLLGATLRLSNVERDLMQSPFQSIMMLNELLSTIAHLYDVAVVDTPPRLDFLTGNALAASDAVFVPIESGSKLSMIGTDDMRDFIRQAQKINQRLRFGGAILTMHDPRKTLCKMTELSVREKFGDVLETTFPASEPVRHAQAIGKTILAVDRMNTAARSVRAIAREIGGIIGLPARGAEKQEEGAE